MYRNKYCLVTWHICSMNISYYQKDRYNWHHQFFKSRKYRNKEGENRTEAYMLLKDIDLRGGFYGGLCVVLLVDVILACHSHHIKGALR